MTWVIEPASRSALPVMGSQADFPVGNLFCVGRNYADHAIEMGHDPDREPPFFFMKPGFAVLAGGGDMKYPAFTQDLHHEVELVVALHAGGQNIPVSKANELIFGYGVGIDLTRRDLQADAKDKGRPWEAGKVFQHAAPCSALQPRNAGNLVEAGEISLAVNGVQRQSGNLNQMIWKIPEVISRLSELFILQPGDLIFTGTPAGVGPLSPGDDISAVIQNVGELKVQLTDN